MDFAAPGMDNLLALVAIGMSILSLFISAITYGWSEQRERRVEKSTAYLNLEVNSSEVFRYAAEKAKVLKPLRCAEEGEYCLPDGEALDEAQETAENLYYQSLNLFEVCARFRRQQIVEPEVFASWVAWFYEVLEGWYFRKIWDDELRENYTEDVRAIFDAGCDIFESTIPNLDRKDAFYRAVDDIMSRPNAAKGESAIREWRNSLEKRTLWKDLASYPKLQSPGTSLRQPPPTPQPSPPASSEPTPPISATAKSRPD